MNPIICSVLIPTRGRVPRLLRCIESITTAAKQRERIEFILRIDDDDEDTINAIRAIQKPNQWPPIFTVIGPRGVGYASVHNFYTEAGHRANGQWCWMMNDDAQVTQADGSVPWDVQLSTIPDHSFVQPEFHQLNASVYRHDAAAFTPIVQTGIWKSFNPPVIPSPVDTGLYDALVVNSKWKVVWLEGVTAFHDRDIPEVMEQHRAM